MSTSASLQATEDLGARGATHPRVSLADINANIGAEYGVNAYAAVEAAGSPAVEELRMLSIYLIVMKNGFVVIGKSAPASPENFDSDKGYAFAREDAIRQIWPLMGFSLRDRLSQAS